MSSWRNCRIYSSEEGKRGEFPDDGFLLAPRHRLSFPVPEDMEELGEFSKLKDEGMLILNCDSLLFVVFIK